MPFTAYQDFILYYYRQGLLLLQGMQQAMRDILHGIHTNIMSVYSVALVRKRTIPSEPPPLVGEVSVNFCGLRVLRGQRNKSPRPLISIF
jgi:hypothetical protein